MPKPCNKCGKPFVNYSKANDTCNNCFKESHHNYQGNKNGRSRWRVLLDKVDKDAI